jgi:hypothetical protein
MRKIAAALLILLAVVEAAHAKEIVTGGPRIKVDETEYDFGTISQYTSNEHVFKFENTGTETLEITKVHASCGCTGTLLSEDKIEPGESGELKVTFKSGTFSDNVRKHIYLNTNDPANKKVTLSITANILADVVCTPRHVNFGRVSPEEPPEFSVKLFSPSDKKFTIKSVKPSLEFIKAEIVSPQENGPGEHIVRVMIDGPPPPGTFQGTVLINTDLDARSNISVTVSGYVRARTEIVPPKLFFGVVRVNEHPTRQVVVRANSWEGLKVEKVKAPEGIAVTAEEVTEGKEWRLSAQMKGPFTSKIVTGRIKLYLNDPQMREVEVKVYGLISQEDPEVQPEREQ